jgi:hypothetical protein
VFSSLQQEVHRIARADEYLKSRRMRVVGSLGIDRRRKTISSIRHEPYGVQREMESPKLHRDPTRNKPQNRRDRPVSLPVDPSRSSPLGWAFL